MIRKRILLFGILILAGILCFLQPAFASEGEGGRILGIGDLSGELIDWDSSIDIWHGDISLNVTLLVTNAGDESISIWWEVPDSKDSLSVPGNWRGEIIIGVNFDFIKRDFEILFVQNKMDPFFLF